MKFLVCATLIALYLTSGCKSQPTAADSSLKDIEVTAEGRLQTARSARAFFGIENPSSMSAAQIKNGPRPENTVEGKDYFAWGSEVTCLFSAKNLKKRPGGMSPKFWCDIQDPSGKVTAKAAKIKYDASNPEVYNEPGVSRLFWLLGFPADFYYTLNINCLGCPQGEDPWSFIKKYHAANPETQLMMKTSIKQSLDSGKTIRFSPAVIEKKWAEPLYLAGNKDSGWSFVDDLALQESALDFPAEERAKELAARHALIILSGMIAHVDNQPSNQRFYCKDRIDDENCVKGQAYFVIQDLGATLGGFRLSWDVRNAVTDRAQLELGMRVWESSLSTAVFVDSKSCRVSVASLSPNRTLGPNKIAEVSEAGRKFLLSRFVALGGGSGDQMTEPLRIKVKEKLRNVFEAGRNGELYRNVDFWVDTLMAKLKIVEDHPGCSSSTNR